MAHGKIYPFVKKAKDALDNLSIHLSLILELCTKMEKTQEGTVESKSW